MLILIFLSKDWDDYINEPRNNPGNDKYTTQDKKNNHKNIHNAKCSICEKIVRSVKNTIVHIDN